MVRKNESTTKSDLYIYTYILKWTRWNKYALLGEESVWG